MLIGYARVSTTEQDTGMQLAALRKAGVRKVFEESRSAVKRRPQLLALLDSLREGDVIVVYKLDRLARSMRDLLDITDRIDQAGARFRSITEAIDTSTPAGEMVMHMIGAMAQFERGIIRERSIAGMELARANGVRLGRLPALDARVTAQLASVRPLQQNRVGQDARRQHQHRKAHAMAPRPGHHQRGAPKACTHRLPMARPTKKARAWRALAKGMGAES